MGRRAREVPAPHRRGPDARNGPVLPDGLGGFNQAPDVMAQEITLHNPCDMTDASVYLTRTRYIVVKEA